MALSLIKVKKIPDFARSVNKVVLKVADKIVSQKWIPKWTRERVLALAMSFTIFVESTFNKVATYVVGDAIVESVGEVDIPQTKPNQVHHYATDKNQTYTPEFEGIAKKYGLDLDDDWNKEFLPHQGRHPNSYQNYVLESMRQYDSIAQGNKNIFLQLFENLKKEISSNPNILYKDFWNKK